MTKILYVEDNEDNVYMLSMRLRRHGFEVLVAPDGAQGVAMARAEAPALILMDMSLPVLDGWQAARQLKAEPETCAIPIIALTAHAMAGEREKALAAGCDEYDTKPIKFGPAARQDPHLPARDPDAVTLGDAALLVVDDNEDNRFTLIERLKREGCTRLSETDNGH